VNFNEDIEEDSTLFDIVDSVELEEEEYNVDDPVEELDFEREELDDFEEMMEKPDEDSDILE
jgi:hypothetical protein